MHFDFSNKKVLIIGGSSGIGLSIVTSFLDANAKVYSVSRSAKKIGLAKTAIKKNANQQNALFYAIEENSIEEINKVLRDFEKRKIYFDVLVNCNGYYEKMDLLNATVKFWDETYYSYVKLNFFAAQTIVKNLVKNKAKRSLAIINLGSFASILPSQGFGLYASSKAALANLTRSTAAEWAQYNVRVNCIIPGVIETPMTKEVIKDKKAKLLLPIALKRIGKPIEIAHVALFLASDYAAYICGAIVEVTGGKYIIQN